MFLAALDRRTNFNTGRLGKYFVTTVALQLDGLGHTILLITILKTKLTTYNLLLVTNPPKNFHKQKKSGIAAALSI
jgi:hypothetical protein